METKSVTNPRHNYHLRKRKKKSQIKQNQCSSSSTSKQDSDPPMEFPSIPDELIIEILTWLPVKSLLRFRCVAESWLSLISSQCFIKAHLNKSSNNDDYTHHRIIYHHRPSSSLSKINQFSLDNALRPESFIEATEVDYPNRHDSSLLFSIVGSCNGLLCMAKTYGAGILLWNPSIKKYKELPSFGTRSSQKRRTYCDIAYGFGYDESNDDYKVVQICIVDPFDGLEETRVKVYSRKTNSWKRIADFKSVGRPRDKWGYFANGKLHWTVGFRNGSWQKIVSLDLANETYGEVEQPEYGDGSYDRYLQVDGGRIFLICVNRSNHHPQLDFWVMKEYGVKESWTRVVLEPYDYPGLKGLSYYTRPVFVTKNEEILFQIGAVLAVYNPKHNSLTYSNVRYLDIESKAHIYVESLVVPDAYEGTRRRWARKCKNKE